MKHALFLFILFNGFCITHAMRIAYDSGDPSNHSSTSLFDIPETRNSSSSAINEALREELLAAAPDRIRNLVTSLKSNNKRRLQYAPHVMILKGPYGVGKSTLAESIPLAANIPYKLINNSLLEEECRKVGAQTVSEGLENFMISTPMKMLIIDDMQGFKESDDAQDYRKKYLLWRILGYATEVDNPTSFVIATTHAIGNLPDLLKSRFADCFTPLPKPDLEGRKRIIRYYITEENSSCASEKDIHKLASQTKDCVGRELKNIVKKARSSALSHLSTDQKQEQATLTISAVDFNQALALHQRTIRLLNGTELSWKDKTRNLLCASGPYIIPVLSVGLQLFSLYRTLKSSSSGTQTPPASQRGIFLVEQPFLASKIDLRQPVIEFDSYSPYVKRSNSICSIL